VSQVNGNIRICISYKCSSAGCLKLLQESNLCVCARNARAVPGCGRNVTRGAGALQLGESPSRGLCARLLGSSGELARSRAPRCLCEDLFRRCWQLCPRSTLTFAVSCTNAESCRGPQPAGQRDLSTGVCVLVAVKRTAAHARSAGPPGGCRIVKSLRLEKTSKVINPTVNPTPPCLLNHVLKCHMHKLFEHLQSRFPEPPLLCLAHETSSIWTNKLELTDMGRKVAGDVHGVDPLEISLALGICFQQPWAVTHRCDTVKCHPCPHVTGTCVL